MKSLNSVLLEGVLLEDPVLIQPTDALAAARATFTVASDPDPAQVPIVAYGRLAAYCAKHLIQGSVIRIVGRIAQDAEASAATGTFRLCILAEHIEPKPSTMKRVTAETADVGF